MLFLRPLVLSTVVRVPSVLLDQLVTDFGSIQCSLYYAVSLWFTTNRVSNGSPEIESGILLRSKAQGLFSNTWFMPHDFIGTSACSEQYIRLNLSVFDAAAVNNDPAACFICPCITSGSSLLESVVKTLNCSEQCIQRNLSVFNAAAVNNDPAACFIHPCITSGSSLLESFVKALDCSEQCIRLNQSVFDVAVAVYTNPVAYPKHSSCYNSLLSIYCACAMCSFSTMLGYSSGAPKTLNPKPLHPFVLFSANIYVLWLRVYFCLHERYRIAARVRLLVLALMKNSLKRTDYSFRCLKVVMSYHQEIYCSMVKARV